MKKHSWNVSGFNFRTFIVVPFQYIINITVIQESMSGIILTEQFFNEEHLSKYLKEKPRHKYWPSQWWWERQTDHTHCLDIINEHLRKFNSTYCGGYSEGGGRPKGYRNDGVWKAGLLSLCFEGSFGSWIARYGYNPLLPDLPAMTIGVTNVICPKYLTLDD